MASYFCFIHVPIYIILEHGPVTCPQEEVVIFRGSCEHMAATAWRRNVGSEVIATGYVLCSTLPCVMLDIYSVLPSPDSLLISGKCQDPHLDYAICVWTFACGRETSCYLDSVEIPARLFGMHFGSLSKNQHQHHIEFIPNTAYFLKVYKSASHPP